MYSHINSFFTALFILFMLAFGSIGCRKFLEVPPAPDQQTAAGLFSTDQSAETAVIGIYTEMVSRSNVLTAGIFSLYAGLAADEYTYYTPALQDEIRTNEVSELSHSTLQISFWQPAYRAIYTASSCIEQLEKSTGISAAKKRQLLGEVQVLRAFHYYCLINLFGGVPLTLSSDYAKNSIEPRASYDAVIGAIKLDLETALEHLTAVPYTDVKARVNKGTALALLAKVAALENDWTRVTEYVNRLVEEGNYQLEEDLDQVFRKDSREAIWQLSSVQPQLNTYEGNIILPLNELTTPTYLLTDWLWNSFEEGDVRASRWIKERSFAGITLRYPYKFKVRGGIGQLPETECNTPLRLADLLLLRSEAYIRLGQQENGLTDLNLIRSRAGLAAIQTGSTEELVDAILRERRWELFGEWGNRWIDVKRTGKADALFSILKPNTWQSTDQLWPIPIGELNSNTNLTQNIGY